MKSTLLFFLLSIVLLNTNIQSGFAQNKISGGSGGFHFGYKFYNTQNYSSFLQDGVADLNNNLISVGGGGYVIYKNFMLGGRGFYQSGESRDVAVGTPLQDSRKYTYSLKGGGGYLNLGYSLHSSKDLLVFPQIGIGYETLTLEKALNEIVSFDPREALSAEYRWGSPMLDIGAGVDWFPFAKNGTKVGLRLGYTIAIEPNSGWSHAGNDFIDLTLPKNDLNGFYINVVIGGGGITTNE